MTNSHELGGIAFRSTLTNNVSLLKRDLTRFRDDHTLLKLGIWDGFLFLRIYERFTHTTLYSTTYTRFFSEGVLFIDVLYKLLERA